MIAEKMQAIQILNLSAYLSGDKPISLQAGLKQVFSAALYKGHRLQKHHFRLRLNRHHPHLHRLNHQAEQELPVFVVLQSAAVAEVLPSEIWVSQVSA